MMKVDDDEYEHITLKVIESAPPSLDLSLTKSPELADAQWSKAGEDAAGEIALEAMNAYLTFNAAQIVLLAEANKWALNLVWIPIFVGGITGVAALIGGDTAILVGLITSSVGNTLNAMAAGYTRSKHFHDRQERYSTYAKECKIFATEIKIMLKAYPRSCRPPFTKCMTEWMKRWGELTTNQPEFAKECEKNCHAKRLLKVSDFIVFYRDDQDGDHDLFDNH